MGLVTVGDEQLACVQEYSDATGVSVQDCIDDAMDTWIRVVARTIYQPEKCNIEVLLPAGAL
jgi:hypothetical protein